MKFQIRYIYTLYGMWPETMAVFTYRYYKTKTMAEIQMKEFKHRYPKIEWIINKYDEIEINDGELDKHIEKSNQEAKKRFGV